MDVGFTTYTTSTTVNGLSNQGGYGSGANLGLILGITIPLVILRIYNFI